MPIYEYRCRDCDEVFQRLQPVGGTSKDVRCPTCSGRRVERLLSSFASSSSSAGGGPAGGCGPAPT